MRTAKGIRKSNDWEKAPGSFISCQKCGKVLQKSLQTNSIIYCPRCGFENYTYLENNMKIQFPARLLDAENAAEHIKAAVTAMQKLRVSPIREYDLTLEDETV